MILKAPTVQSSGPLRSAAQEAATSAPMEVLQESKAITRNTGRPLMAVPNWDRLKMDRLKSLRKSIADMSLDELREHVRYIRIQRRIVKDKPATKRKKVVASDKSKKKVGSLLDKMSAEQLRALLGEFEDGTTSDEGSTASSDQGKG